MEITVTLTETQYKGLQYAASSPEEWAQNFITERARIANDEIVQIAVQYCLDNGIQVPSTREEIVYYAFSNQLVKTAQERNAEFEASSAYLEQPQEPV